MCYESGGHILSSDFRFSGYRRRIARRFVHTVAPRWPNFDTDLTDDVLDGFEHTVRHYPPFVRFGIVMMLFFIEFGGPLTFTGFALSPFCPLMQLVDDCTNLCIIESPGAQYSEAIGDCVFAVGLFSTGRRAAFGGGEASMESETKSVS